MASYFTCPGLLIKALFIFQALDNTIHRQTYERSPASDSSLVVNANYINTIAPTAQAKYESQIAMHAW